MLVEGPDYLNCPIHQLRSMAAATVFAPTLLADRIVPDAMPETLRLAYTQALGYQHEISEEDLERTLNTLQAVLPTPEQRRKEQEEARIEPEFYDRTYIQR